MSGANPGTKARGKEELEMSRIVLLNDEAAEVLPQPACAQYDECELFDFAHCDQIDVCVIDFGSGCEQTDMCTIDF